MEIGVGGQALVLLLDFVRDFVLVCAAWICVCSSKAVNTANLVGGVFRSYEAGVGIRQHHE